MKKLAIIGVFIATLAAAPQVFALNTITFTPTSGGASYLNSSTASFTWNDGNFYYIKIVDPNGVAHKIDPAVGTWRPVDNFTIGTGSFAVTFLKAGEPAFDWTICGNWIVHLYSDSGFTTEALNAGTFPQGIPCSTGPVPIGGATSTLDQAESNLGVSFAIFFACFFGMIWLLRKH